MTDDNRNLLLAVFLSVLLLFGWSFVSERWLTPPTTATADAAKEAPASAPAAPDVAPPAADSAAKGGAAPVAVATGQPQALAAALKAAPRVRITTPRLAGSINLDGAKIDDLVLTDQKVTVAKDSPSVRLLAPSGTANAYFAGFGWIGDGAPSMATRWTADRTDLAPGAPVTLSWTNPAGVAYALRFAVDKNYLFTVTASVKNGSKAPVALAPYGYVNRTGTGPDTSSFINHVGPVGVLDGTLKESSYKDVAKEAASYQSTGGWLGLGDHYWLAAIAPDQKRAIDARFTPAGPDRTQVDFRERSVTLAPGAATETTSLLYAGAKDRTLLDQAGRQYGIEKFDFAISWGWLGFLVKPITDLLHWLYGLVGNYALAIVCLTLIVRVFLYPLANKQYASMAKMRIFQPKMKEIQQKFKGDKQKQQQAMMELYRKEKINPLSGCLPVVVQVPIFYSLYKTLLISPEIRHAPGFLWIHDLAAPDPLTPLNLFGLLPYTLPPFLHLGILSIILGATLWAQFQLNPQAMDPMQRKIFSLMPLVFMFIMAPFAAGLHIYWIVNNVVSIAQQWLLLKKYPRPAPAS